MKIYHVPEQYPSSFTKVNVFLIHNLSSLYKKMIYILSVTAIYKGVLRHMKGFGTHRQ